MLLSRPYIAGAGAGGGASPTMPMHLSAASTALHGEAVSLAPGHDNISLRAIHEALASDMLKDVEVDPRCISGVCLNLPSEGCHM